MSQEQNMPEKKDNSDKIYPSLLNLPDQINGMQLRSISWKDFKGKIPNNALYSAHIYWNIQYDLGFNEKKRKYYAKVNVKILSKSWSIKDNRNSHLLMHQYGHYLIGCICALAFQNKINNLLRQPMTFGINEWCRSIFQETLQQYLRIQKKYDEETEHRLNFQKQEQWEKILVKTLQLYFDEQSEKPKSKYFKIHKLPKIRTAIKSSQS